MVQWSFGELAKNNDCKSAKTGKGKIQIADQLGLHTDIIKITIKA